MNLDTVKIRKICKYFKYEKSEYIQRFYRNKGLEIVNVLNSKNEGLLTSEKSQKKKL